jgi:hypothetical protein
MPSVRQFLNHIATTFCHVKGAASFFYQRKNGKFGKAASLKATGHGYDI